jgi:hypothetical protein
LSRIPDGAPNSVRVGVRLDKMKPFGGSLNEEEPCWEVNISELAQYVQRGLLIPEINLIVQPIRAVDYGLNHGIDDIAAVQGDFHSISELELLWGWVGISRHGGD